jgi:glutamyl-tRNA synthetase
VSDPVRGSRVRPPKGSSGAAAPKPSAKAPTLARPEGAAAPPQLSLEDIRKLGGEAVPVRREVRFRFAPSPTGALHIGGARTALLNYLAAKRFGGRFFLRIEDTDHERSRPEHTRVITEGLKWLGINWDGELAFQSQRTALYRQKVTQLLGTGHAYRGQGGEVRFRLPAGEVLEIDDRVKGKLRLAAGEADGLTDFVIQRADGTPTFLLANTVDDAEQGITHIIRGDDHLMNALKQIALFKALGYPVPQYFHVPLIHGDDGAKLSKRHGATSVLEFQKEGYEPEVVVNHLARLGMGFDTEQTLPVEDLAHKFDPLRLGKAPSRIAKDALDTRNRRRLSELPQGALQSELTTRAAQLTLAQLAASLFERGAPAQFEAPEQTLAERLGPPGLAALADAAKNRASTYREALEIAALVVSEPVYPPQERAAYLNEGARTLLAALRTALAKLPAAGFEHPALTEALQGFNAHHGVEYPAYHASLRWALTGLPEGLPLHHTLALLGREQTLLRLERALAEGNP